MRYGGGQRPFNEWQRVQICDKQHTKRFPPSGVPSQRREGLHKNTCMVNRRCLCNPSHQFLKEFIIKSFNSFHMYQMNGKASTVSMIMVVCLALEAIMKYQVEQLNKISVTAQGSKLTTNWSHMRLDFWLCA